MSVLRVLSRDGDTTYAWDLENPDLAEEVRREFDRVIANGYMAFRVDSPTSGEVIRSFDPTASEIIMTAPMVGG